MSRTELTLALWAARDFGKFKSWAQDELTAAKKAADESRAAFFRSRARSYAAEARKAYAEVIRLQKKLAA